MPPSLFLLAAATMTVAAGPPTTEDPAPRLPEPATLAPWAIVIHGGAGVIERAKMTPEKEKAVRDALAAALDRGKALLEAGGSALDAVEAAVVLLEDDPNFNAGRGAVLTYDGDFSLDAAIMDGATRAAGSVAGTSIAKNPVRVARAVMADSPHVMLSGAGADQFVRERRLETAGREWFETPERRQQWEEFRASKTGWFDKKLKYGTVGAVALDQNGHVAAATSTGGLTGKRWGRIGDSPLIGAGTYADDKSCAVSATGSGEYFIRAAVARSICARIQFLGEKAVPAARTVMDDVKALGGSGGVIVVTPSGQLGWSFNTPGMYRGFTASTGKSVIAIYGEEN